MKTRITELLDIQYPIICAGMSGVATPELAAAVSNAGGLGIVNLTTLTPEKARSAISSIRRLTDRPFGIHMTQLLPAAADNIAVAIGEKVPVINTAFGKCDWYRDEVHQYGGKVVATTSTFKHAMAAQNQGADAVILTSYEAAAHAGAIGAMAFIPAASDGLDIPIIAAGGIADGRGLVAALALGADAVSMGTRFLVSHESAAHEMSKRAVIDHGVSDTLVSSNYDGIPVRVISTPFAQALGRRRPPLLKILWRARQMASQSDVPLSAVLKDFPKNTGFVRFLAWIGYGMFYMLRGIEEGDLETGLQPVGQSQGVVHDAKSASEIVRDIMQEAVSVRSNLGGSDLVPRIQLNC